ncbi:hypothetical protein C8Q73DRAFT_646031 [Cubamyces lactineus]|nr:hypothetical protein C8Q73DRAFT_646031 [Cubamyces lactineus]
MPPKKKARTDASAATITSGRVTRSRAKALKEQSDAMATSEHKVTEQPEVQPQPQAAVEVRIKPQVRTLPLSVIEDLALDVLIEIFVKLHPCDLLSLARTSKAFRAFLMNRRSTGVWKAARRRVSGRIPGCPRELSEPQYAVLVFTSECMRCGQLGVEKAYWEILARYCRVCKATEMEIPAVSATNHVSHISCPDFTEPRSSTSHYESIQYYHQPEVARFKFLLQSRERQKLTKRQVIEYAMAAVQTREKVAPIPRLVKFLTRSLLADIMQRLAQLEWAEELSKLTRERLEKFRALKPVRKVDPLTDREWQMIQGEVVKFMQQMRADRIEDERKVLFVRRLRIWKRIVDAYEESLGSRNPTSDLQAIFSDLALMPQVRNLILIPDISDADLEVRLLELRDSIPQMQAQWYHECEQQLSSLVGADETVAAQRAGISPASMAVVTFICCKRGCQREGLRWPNILAHRCGRGASYTPERGDSTYQYAVMALCGDREYPWHYRPPFIARIVSQAAQGRFRLCGRDPCAMSYADLEEQGVRLYCKICAVPVVGYMEVYDWESAVSRQPSTQVSLSLTRHSGSWAVLDQANTAVAIAYEKSKRMAGDVPDAIFGCTRCRYRSRGFPLNHCETAHKIEEPEIGKDFYLHPETPQSRALWVLMYPEDTRTNRKAARDVKAGRAVFSPYLYNG